MPIRAATRPPALAIYLGTAVAVAAGCSRAAPAVNLGVEEAAIHARSAAYLEAYAARDVVAILMLFSDSPNVADAEDGPIDGLAALRESLERRWAENPGSTRTASIDRIWVSAAGDLAVEFASWKDTGLGPDGAGSAEGRYVRVWRRFEGVWRIWADSSASAKRAADATGGA